MKETRELRNKKDGKEFKYKNTHKNKQIEALIAFEPAAILYPSCSKLFVKESKCNVSIPTTHCLCLIQTFAQCGLCNSFATSSTANQNFVQKMAFN